MRAQEFLSENNTPADKFIQDVYDEYPQTFQNNHVMPFSQEEFAMFELQPSLTKRGAVEIYWFQAYPLRSGVGTKAIQVLQNRAREHGVSLSLIAWDKGRVSQAALTKFYKKQGFAPQHKGSRSLVWSPELEEGWKEKLAAVGLGAAALGGVAVDDYINRPATTQDVQHIMQVPAEIQKPQAPTLKPEKLDVKKSEIKNLPPEKLLATVAKASGIVGNELAQLLAQAAHETLNFTHMAEIGNTKYFSKKYDPKFAPKKAKALGNTQIGDGERYKGRGFLQITGRYNYAQAGKALGLPLEQNPELLERPDVAAKAAVWYWNNRVAPKVGNFDNQKAVKQVTKAINPGMKHLKQRQEKLKQYKSTNI